MKVISESGLLRWSKRVFKLGYIFNRFILYVGLIWMFFFVFWFSSLWVTKKKLSLFDGVELELVNVFERYIIQNPSYGTCFLTFVTMMIFQIYFTGNFFKFLTKLMNDLYSYRYNNYDMFNINSVLQDIIVTIKNMFILEIIYLLVLNPLMSFLYDEKYFSSVLNDRDTDSSSIVVLFAENFSFSLVALIILYLLFSVLKDMLKYKNEYHSKADQLEKESSLVI